MGSLKIIVVNECCKVLADHEPTVYPQVVKLVDAHLQYLKPRFDQVSLRIVDLIGQSQLSKGSPIAEGTGQKHNVCTVVFLNHFMEKHIR